MRLAAMLRGLIRKSPGTSLTPVASRWFWPTILETYPGAWQQHVTVNRTTVAQNWAVFACVTLVAGDLAKMAAQVCQYDPAARIWTPTLVRPVLRKPNRYQTAFEFFKMWVFSLLMQGNTYALKERDPVTQYVKALYILDPARVTPLIAPDGGVYYELAEDYLSGIRETITVPASEMIHDRMHTIFHPLIGVSPIFASGVAAMTSAAIQDNSAKFFQNMSRPGGILTAPGSISQETAERLKKLWQDNFSGANVGKVAVVGDGLEYKAMTINAADAQLIEQLKFTGEMICATFHVPPYKLGLGEMPTVNNVGQLNQQYYDQCMQPIAENIEQRLDDGLELVYPYQVQLDTMALLRMDPEARLKSHSDAVKGGWFSPNEARQAEDLPPVEGGDTPYLQQQNYSLAALARRDASADPFKAAGSAPAPAAGDSTPADATAKLIELLNAKPPEALNV
jgi:HK97 family phage portal protein